MSSAPPAGATTNGPTTTASPEVLATILNKMTQRSRLSFTYRYYDDRGGELVLTAGDNAAREMFKCDFDGVLFDSILGPASCPDTVMKIYTELFHKRSCEEYLNLYGTDGTWHTSFVSFRIVPYANDDALKKAGHISFGILNVAKPSAVGSDIDALLSSTELSLTDHEEENVSE